MYARTKSVGGPRSGVRLIMETPPPLPAASGGGEVPRCGCCREEAHCLACGSLVFCATCRAPLGAGGGRQRRQGLARGSSSRGHGYLDDAVRVNADSHLGLFVRMYGTTFAHTRSGGDLLIPLNTFYAALTALAGTCAGIGGGILRYVEDTC